jgi:putative FmdB family regulatory protein
MPTYEYRCESCGLTVEAVQRFTDAPLTTCETCGGELRKVYAAVGIVFKGSGFYKTDSRTSKSKSASRATSESGESASKPGADAASPSGTTEKASTSKEPAPATSSTSAPATSTPSSSSD